MSTPLSTLVIGASEKPDRYSNLAINRLVQHGHKVYGIGAKPGSAAGITWGNEPIAWPEPIDTVTLYINPTNQKSYYEYIIGLRPRRVIFNPGTENPEFAELLEQHGIQPLNACTLVLLSIGSF